jgi:tetratricopeptide (TPR) repeat protein
MPRLFLFCALFALISTPAAAEDAALWPGLSAYRAGAYDTALVLLGQAAHNPYLETIRLYYRADCLLRDSLYADAEAALETLFALVDSGAVARNFRFVDRAGGLLGEARASRGICIPGSSAEPPARAFNLSSRAALLASRACLAAGDSAGAVEHFVDGAIMASPADSSAFREMFRRCEPRLVSCSDLELLGIAQGARRIRLFPEANAALDRLLARKPSDPSALLERANVIRASGEAERALRAYWRIFESDASVRAKASALRAISSIEYDSKQYDKAAKHYFMTGAYYDDDMALDRAARIFVREKEWKKALRAWNILRERFRGERDAFLSNWIEGGLSEAALQSWLGRDAEANAILREVLPRTRGSQRAAALFWLAKTSASDADRAVWSDSLLRAAPRSFYASIARGNERLLSASADSLAIREIEALSRIAADRLTRCDTAGVDSAFARHPAYRAFVALLDHGFDDEATAIAQAMISIENLLLRRREYDESVSYHERIRRHPVPGRLSKLYAEATRRGFGALSMTILSSTSPTDTSGAFPQDLWYPVLYLEETRTAAESAGVSPHLILAIAREESRFDPDVVSWAGAIGLMQLMPATASWHSGTRDSVRLSEEDLRDPAKNIRAGAEYFRYLVDRCDGSVVAALASYNGGHGRMAQWRENFRPVENPLVALELIGPRETREYVRKVLDSYAVYAAMAEGRGRSE